MRLPLSARRSASGALRRSIPSKSMVPPEIRQPSRVKPMAARPRVDLPAPDSPMSPMTSPLRSVRSTPLMIGDQVSSERPSMRMPRMVRRTGFADVSLMASLLQPAGAMKLPVHDEVDRHRQERDGARRQERRDVAEGDQRRVL